MYRGKHMKKTKKPAALLASLVMLLAVAVVGTAAFLTTHSAEVKNTFTPSKVPNKVVETFNGSTKSDVKIKNEGDVPAYIRVALVATWVKENEQGRFDVYGEQPAYSVVLETDSGWVKSGDYYYYTMPVGAGETTNTLFKTITPSGTAPSGYSLSIEILSQSIQADGVDSTTGKTPVEIAWESATTEITVGTDGVLTISKPSEP